jgi:Transposase and inactivated derivatives, IS30 family
MVAFSLSSCLALLLYLSPAKIVIMVPGGGKVVITLAKNKHLTNEERSKIEHLLRQRESLKEIGHSLGKSTSTISREIKKHSVSSDKSAAGRIPNRCVSRRNCSKFYLCEDKPDCKRQRCSTCNLCNMVCPEFVEEHCSQLESPPYVCNGCKSERICTLRKKYYLHRPAQTAYKELLVNARTGVNICEEELLRMDEFVSPLIKKGQSVRHIVANNPDEFTYSEKSIYRYVNGGLLAARNIDMPRICRLKPRKSKPVEHKVDKRCRIGRSYEDFLKFLADNPDTAVVEMDTVEGKKGGRVLLTMHFRNCGFMLAFLRGRNTSQSVIDVFEQLYSLLGKDSFRKLFPVILTDNGSEFSNPAALETADDETRRTSIFYCAPSSPFQKPAIENNHEFIRRILPKGRSFDDLTQDDVNLMMNHINSYSRERLNNKTPHDSFSFFYGQKTVDALGALLVPPNEIVLRPGLLS